MKRFFYLCLAGLAYWLLPTAARAQTRPAADAPSTAQQLVEEIGLDRLPGGLAIPRVKDARSLSVLEQTGDRNQATITQVSLGNGTNEALIVQAGAANIAFLNQFGTDNTTSLRLKGDGNIGKVDQRGSNNSFDGRIAGDNNKLDVYQDGHGNSSTLDVAGDSRKYPVVQIGDNNSLVQREAANSMAPKGYGVEMRGNGIRLTIEQGHVQP